MNETPNTKLQTPKKGSNPKFKMSDAADTPPVQSGATSPVWRLELGFWNFSCVWCLGLATWCLAAELT